jgi:hypothetical protein
MELERALMIDSKRRKITHVKLRRKQAKRLREGEVWGLDLMDYWDKWWR